MKPQYIDSFLKTVGESKVAKFLKDHKVKFLYEEETFFINVMEKTITDENGLIIYKNDFFYQNDFYLPKYDMYLEVKSSYTYDITKDKQPDIFLHLRKILCKKNNDQFISIKQEDVLKLIQEYNPELIGENINNLISNNITIKNEYYEDIKLIHPIGRYIVVVDPNLTKMRYIKKTFLNRRQETIKDQDFSKLKEDTVLSEYFLLTKDNFVVNKINTEGENGSNNGQQHPI